MSANSPFDPAGRSPVFFDDSLVMLRDQVRRFVETEIKPHADAWEAAGETPRALLRKMGGLGFFGIRYPEALGGSALDQRATIVWAEELGRSTYSGVAITALVHTDMASVHIFNAGNDRMERGDLWQPSVTLLPEAWDLERQEQTATTWLQYSGRLGTPQSASDWHHCSHEEQREPRWRVREVGGVPAGIATKKWWVYDQNEWRSSSWCHRMFCLWTF